MTLNKWLDYIASLHPQTIELGLARVKMVAHTLNLLKPKAKIFTIAGTNGKGSTATLLSTILKLAGYRCALYTSPHLIRFNERIVIDGEMVSDHQLISAFEAIEVARGDVQLTYFEFTTLAAFYIFQHAGLDVWVLEVGLGGRLDAVNIMDPDIAMITTISLDHMDWLGSDREKIGAEKAGIMRDHIPVICADPNPPKSLINAAEFHDVTLYRFQKDFDFVLSQGVWSFSTFDFSCSNLPVPRCHLQNAASVLMALHISGLDIKETHVCNGLDQFHMLGRFQILSNPVPTILDVAHNPESAFYLSDILKDRLNKGRIFAIIGMLQDKDIYGTLKPMISIVSQWFLVDLEVVRGESAKNLANYLHKLGVSKYHIHHTVKEAYDRVVKEISSEDQIVVFGSFYTVANFLTREND